MCCEGSPAPHVGYAELGGGGGDLRGGEGPGGGSGRVRRPGRSGVGQGELADPGDVGTGLRVRRDPAVPQDRAGAGVVPGQGEVGEIPLDPTGGQRGVERAKIKQSSPP